MATGGNGQWRRGDVAEGQGMRSCGLGWTSQSGVEALAILLGRCVVKDSGPVSLGVGSIQDALKVNVNSYCFEHC